ncbi:MAG: Hsp70 family protein [Planctomycetes bacterium]|nr:Hsp70 family protein [Planctomycetota bacterium]
MIHSSTRNQLEFLSVTQARFVVGIDLGTTNCALAYFDTGAGEAPPLQHLMIPQIVQPGVVEERPLLPSFLYLPGPNEQPAGSLNLPWATGRDYCVGEFARVFGSQVPTRLVSSAKSWLCHGGVDRRQPLLPWKAPESGRRVSPLEATSYYLKHLVDAWNHLIAKDVAGHRLEQQDIILTVPASFDAVARELTVEAARAAGLEKLTLLEEPQAAFYSWIDASEDTWRDQVEVGDVVFVCDLGGGTTDLSLIAVTEEAGQLVLTRVAVGDHILLGGDNMDLALAHHAAAQFAIKGVKLDAGQMHMLWHSCRLAKETIFSDKKLEKAPFTVLGRGSKVIGGAIKGELSRSDVEKVLVDGFFPHCPTDAVPQKQRTVGLQEIGLPYAADPGVSKHLAQFLRRNAEVLTQRQGAKKGRKKIGQPCAVLFNGGVFKAGPLRQRLLEVLNEWQKTGVRELPGTDLDRAVAAGAAYYGLVRRGKGIRIRGGTARAYYIGVETSLPAVPGSPPPLKALCVVPFGMEEGTETELPAQEFGLIVGEPAEFRFLGSTTRRGDTAGILIEEWQDQIEELTPLATTLEAPGKEGRTVPVHLHSRVTEVGTLELWCQSRDGKERWKLEFNVRERDE